MPRLASGDIINKVPSLADTLLCAANPETVPLITRTRKGKEISQMKHTVYAEQVPARKTGGATDGQEVKRLGKGRKRFEYDIRAQEFRREFGVGQQTQDVVTDSAVSDQFAKLKLEEGKEMLKDMEYVVLSDTASAADEGVEDRGSRMAGLGNRLQTSAATYADSDIPVEIRIPTGQVITTAIGSTTESSITDAMEARRNLCGASAELVLFCGTKIQRKFNEFEDYVADKASHTTVVRTTRNIDVKRELERGIRFYEGSFGTVEIVIDDFVPDQYRGYLLDMEYCRMHSLGKMVQYNDLPENGGGPRGFLKGYLAYSPGDPRAHIVIKSAA